MVTWKLTFNTIYSTKIFKVQYNARDNSMNIYNKNEKFFAATMSLSEATFFQSGMRNICDLNLIERTVTEQKLPEWASTILGKIKNKDDFNSAVALFSMHLKSPSYEILHSIHYGRSSIPLVAFDCLAEVTSRLMALCVLEHVQQESFVDNYFD